MSTTTKTNQSTSANQTQTPINPAWVTQPLQNLTGQIENLNNTPATSYVAPQGPLQLQANDQGSKTLTSTNPNYTGAASLISGNSSVNPSDINTFMSPFTSDVVNTTNKLFDQNSGVQNAALEGQGAASGAFGGSRFGVAQGVLGGQQDLARGTLDANLENTGFQNAVQSALANKTLGETAGVNSTNLGNSETASNIANTAELANLGGAQQQTAQATATAPISLAQSIAQLLGQNQFGLFQGQNVQGKSNTVGSTTTTDPLAIMKGLLGLAGPAANAGSSLASLFAPA
jgi:hypothetical protein